MSKKLTKAEKLMISNKSKQRYEDIKTYKVLLNDIVESPYTLDTFKDYCKSKAKEILKENKT